MVNVSDFICNKKTAIKKKFQKIIHFIATSIKHETIKLFLCCQETSLCFLISVGRLLYWIYLTGCERGNKGVERPGISHVRCSWFHTDPADSPQNTAEPLSQESGGPFYRTYFRRGKKAATQQLLERDVINKFETNLHLDQRSMRRRYSRYQSRVSLAAPAEGCPEADFPHEFHGDNHVGADIHSAAC